MSEQVQNPFQELVDLILEGAGDDGVGNLQKDFEKFFDKEQKAASTRIRKKLTAIQNWCKVNKKLITEVKNSRKQASA